MGKPSGIYSGNKIKKNLKKHRKASKFYRRKIFHYKFKQPFMGAPMAKGIALEKIGVEAKQPNSAIRKCLRVQLIKNRKRITAFVPFDGCLNYIDINDQVLVSGFGKKGRAKGDIPGVKFKVVKVSGVALLSIFSGKKMKPRR